MYYKRKPHETSNAKHRWFDKIEAFKIEDYRVGRWTTSANKNSFLICLYRYA